MRLSPARWVGYAAALVVALLALLPLEHRLWPVSALVVGGLPFVDRVAGRQGARRRTRRTSGPGGGESMASRLAELEASGFQILRHVDTGRGRIDQVIVGPTGVFVVRVNTWPGRFFLRNDGWFSHNRGDAGELVWEVAREVMAVKARLRAKGVIAHVHGIVAVTKSRMAEPVIHMGRVTFVDGPRVIGYLTSRRRSLSAEQVSRAAAGIPA